MQGVSVSKFDQEPRIDRFPVLVPIEGSPFSNPARTNSQRALAANNQLPADAGVDGGWVLPREGARGEGPR